ncbi:hypothetical protein [Fluviispira multicolorata]|uniref:Uncharacterized protein n=1 Tax=Fluviispira multicolorata TaxID=2654512 RepID=A0A833JBT5_9BACT|nr:hypothetical protein [Fluviispira multicolorata]KAB8029846.1 hypothetical protein GCL57_09925 [Fluviispira multicolorata]
MPALEDLNKRKQELETTLQSLHELIKCRNAVLYSVEKLSFDRVISHKRTLLNLGSKGGKQNFMAISSRAIEVDAKMNRRCLFHLRSKERHLEELLSEVSKNILEYDSAREEQNNISSDPPASA